MALRLYGSRASGLNNHPEGPRGKFRKRDSSWEEANVWKHFIALVCAMKSLEDFGLFGGLQTRAEQRFLFAVGEMFS